MAKKISVGEVDSFMRQLKLVIAGGIVLFLAPLAIYAFYLERRFETFAETLQPNLPQRLAGDDLARGDLQHLAVNPVEGQVVYVPAYSHVYHGKGEPHMLTVTLSVPVRLAPLCPTEVVVERDDAAGGSGANFLVEWYANQPVTRPVIEAVMIDTKGQQGISFVRRGSVVSEVGGARNGETAEPETRLEE